MPEAKKDDPAPAPPHRPPIPVMARLILGSFLFTFLAARILVFLIMSHRIPDLYLHLGETHVHHLNYGIFLLSFVGAALLFAQTEGVWLTRLALLYGVGLGLTFDEFGMWVHLGGAYWQRASFDAVVVIAALFGLIAAAPRLAHFKPRHWWVTAALLVLLVVFGVMLARTVRYAGNRIAPTLRQLEANGPQ